MKVIPVVPLGVTATEEALMVVSPEVGMVTVEPELTRVKAPPVA